MEIEGYYQLKPACYTKETINPESKICLSGSPWVTSIAHNLMADDTHFKDP